MSPVIEKFSPERCMMQEKKIDDLNDTLNDPQTGLLVKTTIVTTKLENVEKIVDDVRDQLRWLNRGIIAILLAVVGWGAAMWFTAHGQKEKDQVPPAWSSQATQFESSNPNATKS